MTAAEKSALLANIRIIGFAHGGVLNTQIGVLNTQIGSGVL